MLFKKKNQQSSQAQLRTLSLNNREPLFYILIYDSYKTLRLRVRKKTDKDTFTALNNLFIVEVKAPKKCAQKYIDDFLLKKTDWIQLKISECMKKGVRPELDFSHGMHFFCLGKSFSFFYKHPYFYQDSPRFLSLKKRVFGNSPTEGEIFAKFPLDQENVGTITPTCTQQIPSLISHITPHTASYETCFINQEDACHTFWKIADTVHKKFSLKIQSSTKFPASMQASLLAQDKQAVLCIKTNLEDFNQVHALPNNASIKNTNFLLQNTIYSKEYFQKKYEKSIRAWRKKSAHFFLEYCFEKVWQGLCGTLAYIPFQIPDKWQKHFQSLQKPSIKIKHLTRRFGSCSTRPKPEITLAAHLVSFPLGLIEYVIIHECCHLIFMDHSKNFYALMEECCPRSLQKRELLWEWSASHIQF